MMMHLDRPSPTLGPVLVAPAVLSLAKLATLADRAHKARAAAMKQDGEM
jgi:hypothetical protein